MLPSSGLSTLRVCAQPAEKKAQILDPALSEFKTSYCPSTSAGMSAIH